MKSEAEIQSQITKFLRFIGLTVVKNNPDEGLQRGWPDLSVYGPNGLHFMLEVKRPGEKPTLLQEGVIKELRDKGHTCEVVHGVIGVSHLVRTLVGDTHGRV